MASPLFIEHGRDHLSKRRGFDVSLLSELVQVVPELQSLVPAANTQGQLIDTCFARFSVAWLDMTCSNQIKELSTVARDSTNLADVPCIEKDIASSNLRRMRSHIVCASVPRPASPIKSLSWIL